MSALPDIQFGIDWAKMAKRIGQPSVPLFQRHQFCALHNCGEGAFYHRKERISALWPEYQWHRWNERRLRGLSDYRWVTWLGPGACVSARTRIYDPINRTSVTIKELHDQRRRPIVLTLYGWELAEAPFVKGVARLFRVTMTNGGSFEATADHRVLTPQGYRRVADLSIGDVLAGVLPSAQEMASAHESSSKSCSGRSLTTSDTAPLTQRTDALDSQRRAEGSQESCSAYSCRDGERLHSGEGTDQASAPSLVDAPECMGYAFEHLGGPETILQHSHPYSPQPLLSSSGFSPLENPSSEGSKSPRESEEPGRAAYGSSLPRRFEKAMLLPSTFEGSSRDERDTGWFCDSYARHQLDQSYGVKVSETKVASITRAGIETYYDITVPFAQHYFAEGAIHHNSGKSADAAVMGLEFWLQAPQATAVVVCSTTMKMLRMRIWNYFASYHSKLPKHLGPVGELLDSDTRIRWEKGNNVAGIFGMAVEEGPVEEVINNLIGLHPQRYLLVFDEAQGAREAIMRATTNMAKNPWFGGLLMGNPDDLQNPLLRESEPLGGWGNTLDRAFHGELEQWETVGGPTKGHGICQFFDGRKSPADDSPAERERLSFLINSEWRANHLKGVHGNENDPSYWSQAIGLPPPKGIVSTVLDLATVLKFKCREPAIWTHGFRPWAALDPSFEGGDKKVLTIGKMGETSGGGTYRWVIGIDHQIEVPIDANSAEPIHYQIAHWCMAYCKERGINHDDFALDSSGEGGGLKAIFDQEWGPVVGIEFGGAPSDTPMPAKPGKTAKDEYDRRSSELNFNVREFALGNGLRGLREQAEADLCERKTFFKNKKNCVEPKTTRTGEKGFKQRTGRSPDYGDSVAIGVAFCIQQGAYPAVTEAPASKAGQADDPYGDDAMKQEVGEFAEEHYLANAQ